METKKWLFRAGSLLILLGFFLPSVLVSCSVPGLSGMGTSASQSMSLFDLANNEMIGQGLLYLVPILLVAAIIVSFINFNAAQQISYVRWAQIATLAACLLIMMISAIGLKQQVDKVSGLGGAFGGVIKDAFQVRPDYGMLFILAGYIVAVVGWWGQMAEAPMNQAIAWSAPPGSPVYGQNVAPPLVFAPSSGGPRLEVITGSVKEVYPLTGDNLMIGRSSECHIHFSNQSVSRMHALLRYAQGSWFIQDQGSSAGIFINGRPVRAGRLNSGDQIVLGSVTMVFKI